VLKSPDTLCFQFLDRKHDTFFSDFGRVTRSFSCNPGEYVFQFTLGLIYSVT
jgi:hypothetical protein